MEYPTILKRVQSTLIDQVISFSLIGLLITLANQINENTTSLKAIALVTGLSYEPLMMFFSRTIGQRITGIKVVSISPMSRLGLINMYVRYVIKLLLGWISLFAIGFNKQRRAIHDLVSHTIVLSKDSEYEGIVIPENVAE